MMRMGCLDTHCFWCCEIRHFLSSLSLTCCVTLLFQQNQKSPKEKRKSPFAQIHPLLQAGIIVDDLVILEHVVRAQFLHGDLESTEGKKRTANARMAYEKFNLPHNPKKGFVNEPFSRFWGIELDGLKGTLRASSLRMWPTAIITLRVCSLGLATIGLLEALAGAWVSLLGVKRRLFSAMEIVFEP